jgi:hypothetical protein
MSSKRGDRLPQHEDRESETDMPDLVRFIGTSVSNLQNHTKQAEQEDERRSGDLAHAPCTRFQPPATPIASDDGDLIVGLADAQVEISHQRVNHLGGDVLQQSVIG